MFYKSTQSNLSHKLFITCTEEEKAEVFAALEPTELAEWNACELVQKSGYSCVWVHFCKVNLKEDVKKSDLYKDSEALKIVTDPDRFVCMLCKKKKKPLGNCLVKLKKGNPSNENRHLNSKNSEELKKMEENEQFGKIVFRIK